MIATTSIPKIDSRWLRTAAAFAVVCAVVVSVLGVGAVPAHAAGIIRLKIDPSSASISAGAAKEFTVTVENAGRRTAKGVNVAVEAPGLEGTADVKAEGCDGAEGLTVKCGDVASKQKKTFKVIVTAKADGGLDEGEKATGTIKASVSSPNSNSTTSAVTIVGVKQVSPGVKGQVKDLDGKGIPEVKVTVTDSEGKKGSATTDGNGNFNISKELAVGDVTLKYEVDGFKPKEETKTTQVGQQLETNVRLDDAAKEDGGSTKAKPSEDDDGALPTTDDIDPMTWVLMALGALLLVGGIIAIVMLMRRRDKDDESDEPAEDFTPSIYKPNATQTGDLGVYDAAQRRPGMDAQTMLHNGPLYVDDPMDGPSAEPASSPGFGPSYSRGDSADTTARRPQSMDELPPTSRSTQPYSSAGDGDESGQTQRGYGTSGFGQSYSDQAAPGNTPTERASQPPPSSTPPPAYGSEPSYGGRGYDASSYGQSGYGRGYDSPGYGNQPDQTQRGYGTSGYGQSYSSQSDQTQRSYGQSYSDEPEPGSGYGDQGQWSNEYPPQPPRQSRPRHYRDDDEDQPRSW
ncbi:MAG TPA: carboxypeptidase regulatory-like domain-containing protein [Candidatus Stackebrandtia faecavium]|nr:carboxypeptidase regulatory-like domain-containing protein [Candidatus Stackebrandtia faecavium]